MTNKQTHKHTNRPDKNIITSLSWEKQICVRVSSIYSILVVSGHTPWWRYDMDIFDASLAFVWEILCSRVAYSHTLPAMCTIDGFMFLSWTRPLKNNRVSGDLRHLNACVTSLLRWWLSMNNLHRYQGYLIWRLYCQKQVSRAWISNYIIPQDIVGSNCVSILYTTSSGITIVKC